MAMTKQVLVSISGLQFTSQESAEPVEIVTVGEYYLRNGKHYVLYEEAVEGFRDRIWNLLKFWEGGLEVTKKGLIRTNMVFVRGEKTISSYETPFGSMKIGFLTKEIELCETEDDIDLRVRYSLEVDSIFLADCSIRVRVKSRDAEDFCL